MKTGLKIGPKNYPEKTIIPQENLLKASAKNAEVFYFQCNLFSLIWSE
jgi:hypothetical protein